jgi:hypothetical protein
MKIKINNSLLKVIDKFEIVSSSSKQIVFFGNTNEKAYPFVKFCKETKNIKTATSNEIREIQKF